MTRFKTAAVLLSSFSVAHGFLSSRHNAAVSTVCNRQPSHSSPVAATAVNGSTEAADSTEAANHASPPSVDEFTDDTSATREEIIPPPAIDITATQNSLLRIAASTDRGQYATPQQKDTASQLLSDLEAAYQPTRNTDTKNGNDDAIPPQLAGTWTLLYSNTQLFRSSPFFLAGRSTCKTPTEADQFAWFCEMHRKALAVSNIGTVRQVISRTGRLVNEFEVKAGAIPFLSDFVRPLTYSGGLPVTIDGAIVSTADVTPNDGGDWEIYMDTVQIKGSNIPILRYILDRDGSKLKSRDLSKLLEENVESYETPRPVLRITFVDEGMRIVRDEDDNVFVYGRASDSEEPTDYSGVLPDLGVASLLEGFNDAVTKFYL